MNDKLYIVGGQIKAINNSDTKSGGILIPFTDETRKDLHGEFFDSDTIFLFDVHPIIGKPRLYNHGFDKAIMTVPTGKFYLMEIRDEGVYVESEDNFKINYETYLKSFAPKLPNPDVWLKEQLDDLERYDEMFKNMRGEGQLKYSSGAYWSSVVTDPQTGHIEQWFVEEGSETLTPAMPNGRTQVMDLKSLTAQLAQAPRPKLFKSIADIPFLTTEPIEAKEATESKESDRNNPTETAMRDLRDGVKRIDNETLDKKDSVTMTTKQDGVKALSEEEINDIVSRVLAQVQSKMDMDEEEVKAIEEDMMDAVDEEDKGDAKSFTTALLAVLPDALQKAFDARAQLEADVNRAVEASKASLKGKSKVGAGSHDNPTQHIGVSEDLRYAHLKAEEMQLNYLMVKASNPMSRTPTSRPAMKTFVDNESFLRHMAVKSAKQEEAYQRAEDVSAVKAVKPFKADEIFASDITAQGDEWVAVQYSSTLWEKARNRQLSQTLISAGIMEVEIPQGHESVWILTEGSDPTVYTRTQANDLDTNTSTIRIDTTAAPQSIGTGRVQLTPGELVALVGVTDIGVEDSLIPALPQVNRQLQAKMLETIDQLMINADSDGTINTNINLIDGTPSTTVTARPYYLATNGFLKYALVTGTATSRDGGALDENDYRLTYQLMPSAIREQREKLVFIIDSDTHDASLDIAAIKTDDVRRTNATITSGLITNIYGINVFRTGFMPLANSAGKVPTAGGTLGRILCVYAPYWALGWKRHIAFEQARDIYSASNLIAVTMRMGLVARGAGASTVSYNLTV